MNQYKFKASVTRLPQMLRLLVIPLLITAAVANSLNAAARDRVKIVNGNVVADDNTPLRGAPFFMEAFFAVPDMQSNESLFRNYFSTMVSTYHVNVVRISPWLGQYDYDMNDQTTRDRYIYMCDKVVDWCEEEGIYALLNAHSQYHAPLNWNRWKKFWDVFAGRYANRTHVFYEANNEPRKSDMDSRLTDMYNHIRSRASNTHIVLWTPPNCNAQNIPLSSVQAHSGVNYSNASIGFHNYYETDGEQMDYAINTLRANGYPIILTEMHSLTDADFYPIDYGTLMKNTKNAENRGISWMHWAPTANYRAYNSSSEFNLDGPNRFTQTYLNQLNNWGIQHWPANTGGGNGNSSGGITGIKRLINVQNGKAIETSFQQRTSEWAYVNTYDYWGGDHQHWDIISVGNGYYRIMNVSNGGALEVGYNGRFNEGTEIDAYTYWGGDNQLWYIDSQGNGTYNIKSKGSNYFLGTNKYGWADGVEQRAWENSNRQKWRIENP